MNIERRLTKMKEECDSLLTEKAREEGQLKAWNKQLKENHNLLSVKQGEKELEKLNDKISEMEKEEEENIKNIEEKYNWD